MILGKIPDWGLSSRRVPASRATRANVEVPIESLMDWGMLGYYVGEVVGERIPVLMGKYGQPDLIRHKHFGAAAASSGGVEMVPPGRCDAGGANVRSGGRAEPHARNLHLRHRPSSAARTRR